MDAGYVEVFARHFAEVFQQMAGTEVEACELQGRPERPETFTVLQIIEFDHLTKPLHGQFVMGFASERMAVLLANAISENMGLQEITRLDAAARHILQEFMNTFMGLALAECDARGDSYAFRPPTSLENSAMELPPDGSAQNHLIRLKIGMLCLEFVFCILERAKEAAPEADTQKGAPAGPRKVLVVDDSSMIRSYLRLQLQQAGYIAEEAEDGRQAVERHVIFQPDVVVLDLVMPNMGGLEAAEQIRAQQPDVQLIILSSSGRADEKAWADQLGVEAYLKKPVQIEDLLAALEKAPA